MARGVEGRDGEDWVIGGGWLGVGKIWVLWWGWGYK